jgi:hypothetical protein
MSVSTSVWGFPHRSPCRVGRVEPNIFENLSKLVISTGGTAVFAVPDRRNLSSTRKCSIWIRETLATNHPLIRGLATYLSSPSLSPSGAMNNNPRALSNPVTIGVMNPLSRLRVPTSPNVSEAE